MTNLGLKIWDTSLVDSKLSPWLSQISSWACLWNALSLSPQTQQNIYNIWAQSLRFEPETRLKSFHETGPWWVTVAQDCLLIDNSPLAYYELIL